MGRVAKEAKAERKTFLLSEELRKQFPPVDMPFSDRRWKRFDGSCRICPTTATV
jgi:hypothetical protein